MEIHPEGGAAPVKGYVVDVMRKVRGRWLTLEAHPKLFPPQAPKPWCAPPGPSIVCATRAVVQLGVAADVVLACARNHTAERPCR